jgi:hypothetical protein
MEEKCVICETIGNEVDATEYTMYNGDRIPCCIFHKDLIDNDLFFNDYEESDEQEDY